jgi:hypothetical protein
MTLTKEQRIELLAKARLAKANKKASQKEAETEDEPIINVEIPEPPKVKKTRKKNEVVPLPVPVEVIEEPDDEPEEPVVVSKKKVINSKWLKPKTEPPKVCCNEKLCKEEYVIDDEKPQMIKEVVIPSKTALKKPRAPRASTPARTLDLTEKPRDIEEVIEELKVDNSRYLPKVRQAQPPVAPVAPITIIHEKLRLFDY